MNFSIYVTQILISFRSFSRVSGVGSSKQLRIPRALRIFCRAVQHESAVSRQSSAIFGFSMMFLSHSTRSRAPTNATVQLRRNRLNGLGGFEGDDAGMFSIAPAQLVTLSSSFFTTR